jgi:hypothetical protein
LSEVPNRSQLDRIPAAMYLSMRASTPVHRSAKPLQVH